MQSCTINREAVTVLYGHLTIADLSKKSAKTLTGNVVATLAPARSHDSDGNRKHLHLSIHRGTEVQALGYVQTEEVPSSHINSATIISLSVDDVLFTTLKPYLA